MDELKRFFNSINFSYTSDFDNTVISKVVLNRETKTYNVYLNFKNIIDYEIITELFKCLLYQLSKSGASLF